MHRHTQTHTHTHTHTDFTSKAYSHSTCAKQMQKTHVMYVSMYTNASTIPHSTDWCYASAHIRTLLTYIRTQFITSSKVKNTAYNLGARNTPKLLICTHKLFCITQKTVSAYLCARHVPAIVYNGYSGYAHVVYVHDSREKSITHSLRDTVTLGVYIYIYIQLHWEYVACGKMLF